MLAVYDVLLRATEIVDGDLTDVDDDHVAALVARHLRRQDLFEHAQGTALDVDELGHRVALLLTRDARKDEIVASSPLQANLRRYCRQAGISLPYRSETRGFGKLAGLALALKEAGGRTRVPRSIIVISDLDATGDPAAIERTLRMLRMRRHTLAFIWPDALNRDGEGGEAGKGASDLLEELRFVYGLQEARRQRSARLMLGRLGIALVSAQSGESTATVVSRAQAGIRAA